MSVRARVDQFRYFYDSILRSDRHGFASGTMSTLKYERRGAYCRRSRRLPTRVCAGRVARVTITSCSSAPSISRESEHDDYAEYLDMVDDTLAHLSPARCAQMNPFGIYNFDTTDIPRRHPLKDDPAD